MLLVCAPAKVLLMDRFKGSVCSLWPLPDASGFVSASADRSDTVHLYVLSGQRRGLLVGFQLGVRPPSCVSSCAGRFW